MTRFARMTDPERRHLVQQLFAEAIARDIPLLEVTSKVAVLFAFSGIEAPVSLIDWMQGKETTLH